MKEEVQGPWDEVALEPCLVKAVEVERLVLAVAWPALASLLAVEEEVPLQNNSVRTER
jgi:hypothetical protein